MSPLSPGGISRLRRALDAPDLDSERYRVIEEVGSGGMGAVYLAEDRLLGRPVALKVLHLEDLSDDGIERMMREARTLARLEHPGIVPVHDLGRLADGRVYYAMKLVRGERLDRHVGPATPVAERLGILLKLCEAVGFAHAAGVLHRDLKPENVMVGEFGEVLVLDWGVAKWTGVGPNPSDVISRPANSGSTSGAANAIATGAGASPARAPAGSAVTEAASPAAGARSARDTSPGTILGTPAYMAPEQARGDSARVDVRTDVFGLGATLWFLLTGRPPGEPGARPRAAALAAICARAMAPDPAGRYASAGELAADIQRFLDGARVLAHREGLSERLGRFIRRHRVAIGLVAAYLLVRALMWFTLRR
jgi:serine/threonine protein kinase